MCASYGLEVDAADDSLSEKVDPRLLIPELREWLAENAPARLGTTRSAERGPFSPLVTAAGLAMGWWWLWVRGAPVKGRTAFNARSEHLLSSSLWRVPFDRQRVYQMGRK